MSVDVNRFESRWGYTSYRPLTCVDRRSAGRLRTRLNRVSTIVSESESIVNGSEGVPSGPERGVSGDGSGVTITQNPVVRERLLKSLASALMRILEQHATGITADELLQLVSREEAQPLEYVAMALSRVDYVEQADGLIRPFQPSRHGEGVTLTEFLLARIHDDESVAQPAEFHTVAAGTWGANMLAHVLRHNPARVLAECEAKRQIVGVASAAANRVTEGSRDRATAFGRVHDGASILQSLALPYADHPDYREEWRP